METLFGYMNCIPPMAYPTYTEMNKDIALCYSNVAKDSMLQAVHEIKDDNDISDIAVSCDGTWKKRGYSSLNCIVTIVSVETGKAIEQMLWNVKTLLLAFRLQLKKYNLRYTQYLGEGDTKSYLEVVRSDPYNGIEINKLECIGHIQKRVENEKRWGL